MYKIFYLIFLQIFSLFFTNPYIKAILFIFQLSFISPEILKWMKLKRYYSLVGILILTLISIFSAFIRFIYEKLFFIYSDLYNLELFDLYHINSAQNITNWSLIIFFIPTYILINRKQSIYKNINYSETNSNSINIKILINLKSKSLLIISGLIYILMILINIIDPTIFELPYPDLYKKQLFYHVFLIIIPLLQTILFTISLRKSVFTYSSIGLITFLTSFEYLIHNPSRGVIAFQFIAISILLLVKIFQYERILDFKRLIIFLLLSLYSFFSFLIIIAFTLIRGFLQDLNDPQGNGFSLVFYLLKSIKLLGNIREIDGFLSIYNYDLYSSINAAFYQLLEVIRLIDQNQSIGFKTFLEIIPNSIPAFIYQLLNIERPIFDGTLLKEYMNSLGGFLIHGNLYWNSGMLGLILGLIIIALASFCVDNVLIKADFLNFSVYFLILPIYAIQYLYGIQGLARALEIVAFTNISTKFLKK